MLAADWQGVEHVDDAVDRRTGQVLVGGRTGARCRLAVTASGRPA